MKTVFGKYRQRTTVLERGYTRQTKKKRKEKGKEKGLQANVR